MRLERETGLEPATNSLEGCDSTFELLPPESPLTAGFVPASPLEDGAGEGIRTPDRLITNQMLYQLSYAGAQTLLEYLSRADPSKRFGFR